MSSPSSPVSARHGANGSPLRKRSFAMADIKADPEGSDDDDDHDVPGHERKRQPGVKRACNECRQQKVSQWTGFPFGVLGGHIRWGGLAHSIATKSNPAFEARKKRKHCRLLRMFAARMRVVYRTAVHKPGRCA